MDLVLIVGTLITLGIGYNEQSHAWQERENLPIPSLDQVGAIMRANSSAITDDVVYAITPVIFVPSDQSYPNASQIADINDAINDAKIWYRTRLGNGQLKFDSIRRVDGELTANEYNTNDTIWTQGATEIKNVLGFSPWTEGHIVIAMGVGLQGWAGGAGTGNSGYAVLGLESLIDNSACAGIWWCTPEVWRGTFIHELGHALTLHHSEGLSIMNSHTNYLTKTLLNTGDWPEQNQVRASPFFQLLLGAGKGNWESCTLDTECLTMRCGCNGSTSRTCLPHDDYGEHCTFSNWAACRENQECQSGRCGCNGGTERVCLPTAEYSVSCTFPNWTACLSDADCITGVCGCGGGTVRVCLPSNDYPRDCAFANFTPCLTDGDCLSSWCDSNGTDSMFRMCLPGAKTCQ
jgi:hypothetical protein